MPLTLRKNKHEPVHVSANYVFQLFHLYYLLIFLSMLLLVKIMILSILKVVARLKIFLGNMRLRIYFLLLLKSELKSNKHWHPVSQSTLSHVY